MDNELIQQILNAVVEGLLPVIMALITLASYYLVKLIYTKTNQIKNVKNKCVNHYRFPPL